ncbi:hypothetical protein [Microbacterium sp. NPDC089696]|uniref:hypothetical protein n=1 Tax=Microbacterium sp. NPDC089696 TaxID=3364199 RepID=UPI003815F674
MTGGFLFGGFTVAIGLTFVVFSRQLADILVAGNYVVSPHRGAVVNASARPWSTRLLGAIFVAFGVSFVVSAALTQKDGNRGTQTGEFFLLLFPAAFLALVASVILLARHRLTRLAARRLTDHAGEIYLPSEVDGVARMLVLVVSGWCFVVAALLCTAAVVLTAPL